MSLLGETLEVVRLLSPLLLGSLAFGVAIRRGCLAVLDRSIDFGIRVRGRPLLGPNKTWRGLVVVAVGTSAGRAILAIPGDEPLLRAAGVGFALGAAAMLAELPNSLAKRRLGVPPGGRGGAVFTLIDQVDLLAGAWLVLGLVGEASVLRASLSLALVAVIHPVVTAVGKGTGLRASRIPRA